MELGILVRNTDMALVTDTGAYERASQKIFHLNQFLAVYGFVTYFEVQHMRHVFHIRFLRIELFFFLFQVDAADITYGNDRTDDADYTKRIGAGISQCDRVSRIIQLVQCFLSGTQTGGIGYSTVQDTYYHWQVYVPVNEVNAQGDNDIQCHNAHCKHVQRHSSFLERGEERRSYL